MSGLLQLVGLGAGLAGVWIGWQILSRGPVDDRMAFRPDRDYQPDEPVKLRLMTDDDAGKDPWDLPAADAYALLLILGQTAQDRCALLEAARDVLPSGNARMLAGALLASVRAGQWPRLLYGEDWAEQTEPLYPAGSRTLPGVRACDEP